MEQEICYEQLQCKKLTNSMGQSPEYLLACEQANRYSASQEIPPPFIETEGSLPCSQQPATGPCPEPDESSAQLPTLFS
jgi:hypothetical protein